MTDKRLKSIADRIEKLMDDRDGIQSDIRDVYAEAKSAGYVPKVLRKAITRKRMDPGKRDEEDTILDLYEDALSPSMRRAVEMARGGATSREIEDETGIDHATVARSVALNKKSETGEVDSTGDAAGHPSTPSTPAEQSVNSDPPLGRVSPREACGQGEQPGTHPDEAPATPSVGAVGVREESASGRALEGAECQKSLEVGAVASPEGERVAPPTDSEALAAMDAAHERMQAALRARSA